MKHLPDLVSPAPGILLVEAELPDFSVRGALVSGADRTVVWDTLAIPDHMAELHHNVPHATVTAIYSHGDWDHVWGTSGLQIPTEEIIAHPFCASRFRTELPRTLEEMGRSEPHLYGGIELKPPTRTLEDPESMDLGGMTVVLEPFPGHTQDSLVGFIPELGILLAGDAAESPLPFLNPDSPIEVWLRNLDRWAERLEAHPGRGRVVPAHGPVAGPELLRANARYLRDLLEGRPSSLPRSLSPFYQETHKNNVALAKRA